jgi:two-component system chemotaxis sensor kinase CheA
MNPQAAGLMNDPQLQKLFKMESEDHLARLDDGLLRLEKTPDDKELLEELFRESHSMKGAARMLGLIRVESVSHNMETILNAARKGETPLNSEIIEQLNSALLDLRQRVQEVLLSQPPPAQTPNTAAPQATPNIIEAVVITPKPSESVPQPALHFQQSQEPQQSLPLTTVASPFRIETVRVETRKLDELLTQTGELTVLQGRAQHRLTLLKELQEEWTKLERKLRKSGLAERSDNTQALLPRFDILLKQACDLFSEDNARLDSTINLLEYQVRNIRLLPLSILFALFPRMVRDLSKEQGKEVELVCEGGDITVDKRILEEMKDPLMHLLRNAVDHGIEPAEEREQRGKSRIGKLRLSAVRENANVVLSVQDDGRGLNPTAIRQQAQKLGLYDAATLAAMTPAQWQQLIFTPGFSINSYVTELSGRGVGLDVVRANVERMKGDIRLESNFRQGMTIQLRLPLSLSTTRLLLASVNGKLYGLPVEFVQTSLRVRKQDIL